MRVADYKAAQEHTSADQKVFGSYDKSGDEFMVDKSSITAGNTIQ